MIYLYTVYKKKNFSNQFICQKIVNLIYFFINNKIIVKKLSCFYVYCILTEN